MTRSGNPREGVDEQRLAALYREASRAEPGPGLDRRILDAARAAVAAKARPRKPWWKNLLVPVSVAAVAVLGVSLTLRVVDEEERQLRQERRAPPAAERAAPAKADAPVMAPAVPPPAAEPRHKAAGSGEEKRAPAKPAVERAAKPFPATPRAADEGDAAVPAPPPLEPITSRGVPAPAGAVGAMRAEPEAKILAPPMIPAPAAAPMQAPERMKKQAQSRALETQREIGSGNSLRLREDRAAPAAKDEAGSAVATDPATPEAWLSAIRELRASGYSVEAAQSLARFRQRYPDYPLPEDLKRF